LENSWLLRNIELEFYNLYKADVAKQSHLQDEQAAKESLCPDCLVMGLTSTARRFSIQSVPLTGKLTRKKIQERWRRCRPISISSCQNTANSARVRGGSVTVTTWRISFQ